jgi:hypothetical protein
LFPVRFVNSLGEFVITISHGGFFIPIVGRDALMVFSVLFGALHIHFRCLAVSFIQGKGELVGVFA